MTDLMKLYEKMEMPADQLELIRKAGYVESMARAAPWLALISTAVWLSYLLYVRRYFIQKNQEKTTANLTALDQP